jgi:hypothetical protein
MVVATTRSALLFMQVKKIRILTLENLAYELDTLPEEIDDMRFSILDNSDPTASDIHQ